jgi:hypothetical protein
MPYILMSCFNILSFVAAQKKNNFNLKIWNSDDLVGRLVEVGLMPLWFLTWSSLVKVQE